VQEPRELLSSIQSGPIAGTVCGKSDKTDNAQEHPPKERPCAAPTECRSGQPVDSSTVYLDYRSDATVPVEDRSRFPIVRRSGLWYLREASIRSKTVRLSNQFSLCGAKQQLDTKK
jgi:hypothetical protein